MRKLLLPLAAGLLVCLSNVSASATANYVYHEQTNNFVATPVDDPNASGCGGSGTDESCGRYVEKTDRSGAPGFQIYAPETYSLHFKVEFQLYTNQVRVYYTTDGSRPCGVRGAAGNAVQPDGTPCGASNTTQVAVATYSCLYSDASHSCMKVDVISASIPPQPAGTTVRYIVSAWHSEGGDEVFGNSGDCDGCFKKANSSEATVFDYNVIAPPATPLIISEFRLRGPNGGNDEYVEIYNNSEAKVIVNAFDGSAGFGLAASDGTVRFTIPNGTEIPARGHYLGVNSAGYSLGDYPASARPDEGGGVGRAAPAPDEAPALAGSSGKILPPKKSPTRGVEPEPRGAAAVPSPSPTPTATGDAFYTDGIADNAGIALFNTADVTKFSTATRLDAVGSTSEMNTLYKEGMGYPAIVVANADHAFFRDYCGKSGSLTTFGQCARSAPMDTGDNATDFVFVEPNGADLGAGARLGAPGPENSASPIQRNELLPGSVLFPCAASSAPPNRVRNSTPDVPNNSTYGTLSFRIRVTNNTTVNVTRLRFRVVDISTKPAPGTADLRARTSPATMLVNNPCNGLLTPVYGTTLETTQTQTQAIGGGFNSSLSASTVTLATPILPGDTYDFQLLVGVEQTGRFKFYVNVEVLP